MIYDLAVEHSAKPVDWTIAPLAQIADVVGGGTPDTANPEYWNPPDIPWVTPTDITACRCSVLTRTERAISDAGLHACSAVLLPKNSTLLTSRATIGECRLSGMPVATNQGFASLIPKEGIDYRFVFYLAQSLKPVFSRLAAGTTFIEVSRREIRRVKVCIPAGPEERTRIGEILSAVDAALQSSRQELSRAILVKTALMQQLFTQGIPGRHVNLVETKLGLIPAKWEVRKLKKCGKWGSGGTPDRANVHFWGGAIPWVKSGEVDYNVITETEERITEAGAAAISGELLPRGTLLVAMYGAGVTRGKAALLGIDAYVNQAIAFFKGDEHTNNEWLLYWFERHYEVVRTFAGGANQDNLSQYLVKNLLVARPQIDEQLETVSILRGASEAIASVERKISALKRLRKSLLHNLVSGSVRVRV